LLSSFSGESGKEKLIELLRFVLPLTSTTA